MMKKKKEIEILSRIYDIAMFEIQENEEPDFLMKHTNDELYFGVEVTEYYYNETNARMDNVAGYSSSLLDGGDFIHKSDRNELKVTDITLISEAGEENIVRAIASNIPSTNEFVGRLIENIRTKNKKYQKYDKTLRHINLIVNNTEHFLSFHKRNYLFHILFTPEFVEVIKESNFNEIFLITEIINNTRLKIPLKLTLFISEYMLYQVAFFEYYGSKAELITPKEYYFQLIEYLVGVGFSSFGVRNDKNETEFFFSDYSIVINENEDGLKIRDWNGRSNNFEIEIFETNGKYIDNLLLDYFRKFKSEFMFASEIGFEIM